MNITLSEVKAGYAGIKKLAFEEFNRGNIESSLDYIIKAATIASQINWRYADDEFEDLLEKISKIVISKKSISYKPNSNRVVFYDYFGSTFILALQYIKTLSSLNFEILYLIEDIKLETNISVIDALKQYENVNVKIIPYNDNWPKSINKIYDEIVNFNPHQLYLHINSISKCVPVLYSLPKSITRYYINLADHAYWLGSKGIDYSFEFRNFGANVSLQKRGLKKNQLILLPYYPVIIKQEFKNFPEQTKNKVVIFSGGDFYKTVDKQNTYWNLIIRILYDNPNAIIIFANKILNDDGEKFLDNFIEDNNLKNRFIPIGFRKDINEVLKHCDIYLGTCPMSGGLMSQYAAINAKPILQYYPPDLFSFEETESMICFNDTVSISFTDKVKLLDEAKKLIRDEDYRIKKGLELQKCMIRIEQFDDLLVKSIETNKTQIPIENISIKFNEIAKWWLEVNNRGFSDVGTFICCIIGKKKLKMIPTLYIKNLYRKINQKLFNH